MRFENGYLIFRRKKTKAELESEARALEFYRRVMREQALRWLRSAE